MRKRKKIRLDKSIYNEAGRIFSLTICLQDGFSLLTESNIAKENISILRNISKKHDIPVYAYCFMPDHLHLLTGVSESMGLLDFVREFKGRSTKSFWQLGHHGTLWQRSFYDHCLRDDEGVKEVARYIFNNPVRAGMVKIWNEHPYSGSFKWELDEI